LNQLPLFHWRAEHRLVCRQYRTAVSLHSHTLHSREGLGFIPRVAAKNPLLNAAVRWQQAHYGVKLDMSRAWWTPPLSPSQAIRLESRQIADTLSLHPLVSLTDHDNIDAINSLAAIDGEHQHPISIEWTVPFAVSFFHLGVHNLPAAQALELVAKMQQYRARPSRCELAKVFDCLVQSPGVLIVLNHPCWDEQGVGFEQHSKLLTDFLESYREFVHALELNGLRPWGENSRVCQLAEAFDLPIISGGDRHGREPNANVNLTNAASFPEFVDEVRRDRHSVPLFLPHYNESRGLRVLQTVCDVLREDKEHQLGWAAWSDRIFYRCDDGIARSLNTLWGDRPPLLVRHFVGMVHFAGDRRMRDALRLAFVRKQEVLS
jgi:hypothetical protein